MNKRYFLCLMFILVLSQTAPGQGWRKAYLPEGDLGARLIQFTDSLNGCVFTLSKFYRSTDGGNNWVKGSYPVGYALINARLVSASEILLLAFDPKVPSGMRPRIYTSSNAGSSWRMRISLESANSVIASNILLNRKAWILGEDFADGKTYCWNIDMRKESYDSAVIPMGHPYPVGNWWYKSLGFRDSLIGYITAGQYLAPGLLPWGLVLKTTDGGRSWQDDTVMYAASFERVEFSDPLHGYVSGGTKYDYDPTRQRWTYVPTIRYTTDGGNSWTQKIHDPILFGTFKDDSILYTVTRFPGDNSLSGYFHKISLMGSVYLWNPIINDSGIFDFAMQPPDKIWALKNDGKTIYIWDPLLSGVKAELSEAPKCVLYQNYPNPAYGETRIRFSLRNSSTIQLGLYDLLGRSIKTTVGNNYEAGDHEIILSLDDLPAGIYMFSLEILELNLPPQRLARIMTHARVSH